ncbi:MAG: hypothetical protein ACOX88_03630 [Christensenellales bacterium]
MEDVQIVSLYWNRDQSAISESNIKYGQIVRWHMQKPNELDTNADLVLA